jgi:hypothetical protein
MGHMFIFFSITDDVSTIMMHLNIYHSPVCVVVTECGHMLGHVCVAEELTSIIGTLHGMDQNWKIK